MYTKQEISLINQQFWTTLGKYLSPILSADGEKINWINYKTGEKNIRFVMDTTNGRSRISIEFSHKEPMVQQEYFEKLLQLEKRFRQEVGEGWSWQPLTHDAYGKIISLVSIEEDGLNILDKSDWPALISFFKRYLVALDKFWSVNKFAFER